MGIFPPFPPCGKYHRCLIKDRILKRSVTESSWAVKSCFACTSKWKMWVSFRTGIARSFGKRLKGLCLEVQRVELPDVRHRQWPRVPLTAVCCSAAQICVATTAAEVHGEVNGRYVSVRVKWRAQDKPERLVLPFCPLGQWQDSFCQGILWGLCAELMPNVFHLPFPMTDAVPWVDGICFELL